MKIDAVHASPVLLLVVFICSLILNLIPESMLGTGGEVYIVTALLQLFIIALPTVIFLRLRGGDYTKKLRLRLPSPGHAAFMIFALMLMFFGSSGINYLMYNLFPDSTAGTTYNTTGGFSGGLYLILTMGVIPAITEEFLFRGVIVAEYESRGVPAAVVMSSLTFAMLHFSLIRLPVYLFCGLVLAVVLYTTRSLFAAMLVHMASNTATVFFGDLVYRVVSSQGVTLFVISLTAIILLSAILMLGQCEKIYTGYGVLNVDSSYTGKRRPKRGILGIFGSLSAPLFLLLVIVYIIAAVVGM